MDRKAHGVDIEKTLDSMNESKIYYSHIETNTLLKLRTVLQSIKTSRSYSDSLEGFKNLIDLLDINELINDPALIFDLHEILSDRGDLVDIGIKFTVQTNLFYGSILQFGTQQHVDLLKNSPKNSDIIGCFALTEKTAGITSGLFLKTRADYNSEKNIYIINTGSDDDVKVWISNGRNANYCVLFANLYQDDQFKHIQPFLIRLRDPEGNVCKGVKIQDMGDKHTITYLDNVSLRFDNYEASSDCIMNKKPIKNFYCIADRLMTGRLIAALTALSTCKKTLDRIYEDYVCKKKIFINRSMQTITLSELPHIQRIFNNFNINHEKGMKIINRGIYDLCDCIRMNKVVSKDLVDRINCAKIFCTETPRDTMIEIQKQLGSMSLLESNTNPSIYVPNIIAEGDTGILRQKFTGDQLKALTTNPLRYVVELYQGKRTLTGTLMVVWLYVKIMYDVFVGKVSREISWMRNYDLVMKISQSAVMNIVEKSKL